MEMEDRLAPCAGTIQRPPRPRHWGPPLNQSPAGSGLQGSLSLSSPVPPAFSPLPNSSALLPQAWNVWYWGPGAQLLPQSRCIHSTPQYRQPQVFILIFTLHFHKLTCPDPGWLLQPTWVFILAGLIPVYVYSVLHPTVPITQLGTTDLVFFRETIRSLDEEISTESNRLTTLTISPFAPVCLAPSLSQRQDSFPLVYLYYFLHKVKTLPFNFSHVSLNLPGSLLLFFLPRPQQTSPVVN